MLKKTHIMYIYPQALIKNSKVFSKMTEIVTSKLICDFLFEIVKYSIKKYITLLKRKILLKK